MQNTLSNWSSADTARLYKSWDVLSSTTFRDKDYLADDLINLFYTSGANINLSCQPGEVKLSLYIEDLPELEFTTDYFACTTTDLLQVGFVNWLACTRDIVKRESWQHYKGVVYCIDGVGKHSVIKVGRTRGGHLLGNQSWSSFPRYHLEENPEEYVFFNRRAQEYYGSVDYGNLVFYYDSNDENKGWARRKEVFLGLTDAYELRFQKVDLEA